MRTLLIDNYDSYTYNLFQLIAEVNGAEPVVLPNDDPRAGTVDPAVFDNAVVSPGPGHPGRVRDVGASAGVIARAGLPVLGVCLGHQAIAAGEGGAVSRAPVARHGYLSTVEHDGRDLFAGIPQGFTAVRYHSLRVEEPLPDSLEATAWSEDGVIMGLRHRERPLWGVQFHPESVAGEYGYRLLANFRELTAEHRRRHRPARRKRPATATPAPVPAPSRTAALPANTAGASRETAVVGEVPGVAQAEETAAAPYRVHVHVLEAAVDTESAFTRLYAGSSTPVFWLDSARVEPGRSRFSFMGDASGPLAEVVSYRTGAGEVEVTRTGSPSRRVPGTVFDYLQGQLQRRSTDVPGLPFDFCGGYVGYFGYELKGDLGSPNRHTSPTPDACWLFADRTLVVDHQEDTTYLLALSDGSPDSATDAERWLDSTAAAALSLADGTAPASISAPASGIPEQRAPERHAEDPTPAVRVEPWLLHGREQYRERIARVHRALTAGESYEVCLTNAAWAPADEDGYRFYQALRRTNPAPYAAYLRFGDVEIASSSPERFLTVDRAAAVETKPIKGTVGRSADPAEDAALRASLAADAKTRAENLMIVDLLRNDLGRVCRVGSVHVPRLMATETYETVHQLVSTVRGTLSPGNDAVDAVRACFPGGSMTGAPKLRTMELIDELETEARGVYSGSAGLLSLNGAADLSIVIRTAVRVGDRWRVGAGGAIVLDSDADDEYEEMLLKADASLRARDMAAPDETGAAHAAASAPAAPAPADTVSAGS